MIPLTGILCISTGCNKTTRQSISNLMFYKSYWQLNYKQVQVLGHHHHHHHEQAPSWRVVVSTRCFQCSRSWVYFHAELRPRLRGWRSASKVRSQVWRGRPGSRLQSLGSPLMETLSALVMSSDDPSLPRVQKSKPSGLDELRQLGHAR